MEPTPTIDEKDKWLKISFWLIFGTLFYNIAEAAIALWAGEVAHSIALFGFGLDSIIEVLAGSAILWRFWIEKRGVSQKKIEHAEHRAHQFIGVTFFLLAAYVSLQSVITLWKQSAPDESLVGIILAAVSLTIMPLVSLGKLKAAKKVGSQALRAEAKETLACSYLSFVLLLGLGANAVLGWWWADPIVALLMIPWLIKEGFEGFQCESDSSCMGRVTT